MASDLLSAWRRRRAPVWVNFGRGVYQLRPRSLGWSWEVPGVASGWSLFRFMAEFDAITAIADGF